MSAPPVLSSWTQYGQSTTEPPSITRRALCLTDKNAACFAEALLTADASKKYTSSSAIQTRSSASHMLVRHVTVQYLINILMLQRHWSRG